MDNTKLIEIINETLSMIENDYESTFDPNTNNRDSSNTISYDKKLHDDSIYYQWKTISKALTQLTNNNVELFNSSVVSITPNKGASILDEYDKAIIECLKYYNLVYYVEPSVMADSLSLNPDFAIFIPCMNKYLFIKYVDSSINTYTDKNDDTNPYIMDTIFIHKTISKPIMMYELEAQLFNQILVCLDKCSLNNMLMDKNIK